MNKKLIAAAVAAGLAAPMAAQADITPYAKIQFEIASYSADDTSGTTLRDTNGLSTGGVADDMFMQDNQRGRFGLKGGHDLGGGLKAFAKVEFDIEGGNRDAEFGGSQNGTRIREANTGLKGSWGKFTIGTMKSAYKYTGGVKYDPFVTTALEARRHGGMSGGTAGHNGFINNALAYQNKFGMVGVWVTYSPDETDRDSGTENNDDGEISAAVKFSQKNWEAFVSIYDNGVSEDADAYDTTKVGGQWRKSGHKISLQYEMGDSAGTDTTTTFLGYQFKMGKTAFVAQLGNTTFEKSSGDEETDYTALGVIHKFNKKTRVFAGWRSADASGYTGATEESVTTVGMRTDF